MAYKCKECGAKKWEDITRIYSGASHEDLYQCKKCKRVVASDEDYSTIEYEEGEL